MSKNRSPDARDRIRLKTQTSFASLTEEIRTLRASLKEVVNRYELGKEKYINSNYVIDPFQQTKKQLTNQINILESINVDLKNNNKTLKDENKKLKELITLYTSSAQASSDSMQTRFSKLEVD